MAYSTTFNADSPHVGWSDLVARLGRGLADYRAYRATRHGLRALSDRQLADIGHPRQTIRKIAFTAVYAR